MHAIPTAKVATKRRATWRLVLPALPCLLPISAHAQLLTRYLPQSVPGYELDPVQAVLQNGGPDYGAAGIRSGDFVIRPSIDETVGYDQNPLGLADGKGSAKVDSAAAVSANSDWARDSLGASLSVDDQRFVDLPIANQRTVTAFAGGRVDIGRDSLDLSAGHVDSDLGPTDVLTQGLFAPVPYSSNDFRADYNLHLDRLTVVPNIDFTTYRFGSAQGGFVAGSSGPAPVISDEGLDKNQFTGGATTYYEFSPGRDAVFVWQETQAEFLHRSPGAPNPNYLDSLFLIGLNYDTLGLFRYALLAGYERRSFATQTIDTLSQPVVEASITYEPSRLTTLNAVVIRHLSDASYNVAENEAYTEGLLRADHALRRNVLLNARIDYAQTDASAGGGQHTQFTAGTGVTWLVSRYVRLSADYTFSHGSSSAGSVEPAWLQTIPLATLLGVNNYSASAITISLHLQI